MITEWEIIPQFEVLDKAFVNIIVQNNINPVGTNCEVIRWSVVGIIQII